MKIYFKNGNTINVSQEVGEAINKNISEGFTNYQSFLDTNGRLFLILNISEIVCVTLL